MHLAARWGVSRSVPVRVATVDHALRPESAAEAQGVAAAAAALGLDATVLRWDGWTGQGNLQAEARAARRRLLADWAQAGGLAAIALAHTRDDQAETVLLRLLRGSGVDGLAAMTDATEAGGIRWLRPLLAVARDDLRAWLRRQGLGWVEDPSNADLRFDRIRARQAMAALRLDAARLAETAARMQDARAVLEAAEADLARRAATLDLCGCLWLSLPTLQAALPETRMRLLATGFRLCAGATYPPRRGALAALWRALEGGQGMRTLHGCVAEAQGDVLRLAREPAAVQAGPQAGPWDGRWHLVQRAPGRIGALGAQGLRALRVAGEAGLWQPPPAWRDTPRAARQTTPALWRDGTLACAPVAAYGHGLEACWAQPLPGAPAR
jgi:tRNA(Ile)-lysidine synthase